MCCRDEPSHTSCPPTQHDPSFGHTFSSSRIYSSTSTSWQHHPPDLPPHAPTLALHLSTVPPPSTILSSQPHGPHLSFAPPMTHSVSSHHPPAFSNPFRSEDRVDVDLHASSIRGRGGGGGGGAGVQKEGPSRRTTSDVGPASDGTSPPLPPSPEKQEEMWLRGMLDELVRISISICDRQDGEQGGGLDKLASSVGDNQSTPTTGRELTVAHPSSLRPLPSATSRLAPRRRDRRFSTRFVQPPLGSKVAQRPSPPPPSSPPPASEPSGPVRLELIVQFVRFERVELGRPAHHAHRAVVGQRQPFESD